MAAELCEALCLPSASITWKRLRVSEHCVTLVPSLKTPKVKSVKGRCENDDEPLVVTFPIPWAIDWDWKAYFANYLTMLAWETVGATGLSPHVLQTYGLKSFQFPANVLLKEDYYRTRSASATMMLDCFARETDSTYETLVRSGLESAVINDYLRSHGTRLLKDGHCTATSRALLFFDPCCGAVLPNLITENPKGLDWKRYYPNYDDAKCWMGTVFLGIGFSHDVACQRKAVVCTDKDRGRKKIKLDLQAAHGTVGGAGSDEADVGADEADVGADVDADEDADEADVDADAEAGTDADTDADTDTDTSVSDEEDGRDVPVTGAGLTVTGRRGTKRKKGEAEAASVASTVSEVPVCSSAIASGDVPNKLFTQSCSCAGNRSYAAGRIRTLAELLVHAVWEEGAKYYDLVQQVLFQVLYTHKLLSVHMHHNNLLPHTVLLSSWSSYAPSMTGVYKEEPFVAYYLDDAWYSFNTPVRAVLSGYEHAELVTPIDRVIAESSDAAKPLADGVSTWGDAMEEPHAVLSRRGDVNRLLNGCLLIVHSAYTESGKNKEDSKLLSLLETLLTTCLQGKPLKENFRNLLRNPDDNAVDVDYYAGFQCNGSEPLPSSNARCGPKGLGVPFWYLKAASANAP